MNGSDIIKMCFYFGGTVETTRLVRKGSRMDLYSNEDRGSGGLSADIDWVVRG